MSVSHVIVRSCQKATSIPPLLLAETVTGDFERNVSLEIPAEEGSPPVDVENYQIDWSVLRAKLQSFAVSANGGVTIYTNDPSDGSPQDTIPLVANQVLIWTLQTDGIDRCPFSGDITTLYVTPTIGGVAVTFSIDAIVNN